MTHAESLDAIAEVGANNYDTSNGTWLLHPTDAATLGAQAKDSGSGQFVYQDGMIAGRRVIETTHAALHTAYFRIIRKCHDWNFWRCGYCSRSRHPRFNRHSEHLCLSAL